MRKDGQHYPFPGRAGSAWPRQTQFSKTNDSPSAVSSTALPPLLLPSSPPSLPLLLFVARSLPFFTRLSLAHPYSFLFLHSLSLCHSSTSFVLLFSLSAFPRRTFSLFVILFFHQFFLFLIQLINFFFLFVLLPFNV